ncbi:hypothetical protein [Burkholderia phage BCSR5]|nr:hypothetical protein [Burkholderia phage BCSR5]
MYSFCTDAAARLTQSKVFAAPKAVEHYDFYTYKGRALVELSYRGTPVTVSKGTEFGVRKSADGKKIRLILNREPNKVYTITLDQAKQLAKGLKA